MFFCIPLQSPHIMTCDKFIRPENYTKTSYQRYNENRSNSCANTTCEFRQVSVFTTLSQHRHSVNVIYRPQPKTHRVKLRNLVTDAQTHTHTPLCQYARRLAPHLHTRVCGVCVLFVVIAATTLDTHGRTCTCVRPIVCAFEVFVSAYYLG